MSDKDKPLSAEDVRMLSILVPNDRNFGVGLYNICVSHELLRDHARKLEERIEALKTVIVRLGNAVTMGNRNNIIDACIEAREAIKEDDKLRSGSVSD